MRVILPSLPFLLLLLLLLSAPLRSVRATTVPIQKPEESEAPSAAATIHRPPADLFTEPPTDYTTPPTLTTTMRELATMEKETWTELVVRLSQMFSQMMDPYLEYIPDFPLDWETTLASVGINNRPMRAVVVGAAALSVPMLIQLVRGLINSIVGLVDSTLFVTSGQGLGRRSFLDVDDEGFLEDIIVVLLKMTNLVTRTLGK